MIDDDMKGAVVLKRSPKELRDHLVLKSPLLAHVEKKFFVMRGPAFVPTHEELSYLKSRQWKLQR